MPPCLADFRQMPSATASRACSQSPSCQVGGQMASRTKGAAEQSKVCYSPHPATVLLTDNPYLFLANLLDAYVDQSALWQVQQTGACLGSTRISHILCTLWLKAKFSSSTNGISRATYNACLSNCYSVSLPPHRSAMPPSHPPMTWRARWRWCTPTQSCAGTRQHPMRMACRMCSGSCQGMVSDKGRQGGQRGKRAWSAACPGTVRGQGVSCTHRRRSAGKCAWPATGAQAGVKGWYVTRGAVGASTG